MGRALLLLGCLMTVFGCVVSVVGFVSSVSTAVSAGETVTSEMWGKPFFWVYAFVINGALCVVFRRASTKEPH
jgi:hypothetical protein